MFASPPHVTLWVDMLNIATLKPQINEMVERQADFMDEFIRKLDTALKELNDRSDDWEKLSNKVEKSKTSWLVAGVDSPPNTAYPLPPRPSDFTVIASDGSQIFPDRHETLPCYLINTGSVLIRYGSHARALLKSLPEFFYTEEDRFTAWDGRRVPVNTEVISMRRTMMEMEEILRLARECGGKESVLALVDGTLILWTLEGKPADFRDRIMEEFVGFLDDIRAMSIPIAGYISYPGSTDVVNALRVGLCPEEVSLCNQCPYTHLDSLPCQPVEGVTDRALFSRVLKEGERSAVFRSSSKILQRYGPHAVCFFYLNTGAEVVRVEVPAWLADDPALIDRTHTLIYDQAKKGGGYPVVLMEAHEQAVVRGRDRDFFFELVREALVKSDFKVRVSRKAVSKRRPVV